MKIIEKLSFCMHGDRKRSREDFLPVEASGMTSGPP